MNATSAPPPELLGRLVERVVFRRKPGILSSLGELTYLIVEADETISRDRASLLIGSLMPWHQATVLPLPDHEPSDFLEVERPELRTFVGRLAGALSIWWQRHVTDATEPKPLAFWRDACASDPLPEIRRAFTTWDSRQPG